MRGLYEKLAAYGLFRALFCFVLGAVMIIFPEQVIKAIIYIIAIYLIANGALKLVAYLRGRDSSSGLELFSAILLLLAGIAMFVFTVQIASILPLFMGILLVLLGVYQVVRQVTAGRYGLKPNVFQIILGIAIVVGGVIGIVNPFGSLAFLFQIFGIFVVASGVNELISLFYARKSMKNDK